MLLIPIHLSLRISLRVSAAVLVVVVLFAAIACNQPATPTFTPVPSPTPFVTATPTQTERAVTAVRAIFEAQVKAIKQDDWAGAYDYCSPDFRQLRTALRFTQDASAQFERDGYTPTGFEARNTQFSLRSPTRVTVSFDAYQGGSFIRTVSVGQNYILVNGKWWDDGTWCKLRVGT